MKDGLKKIYWEQKLTIRNLSKAIVDHLYRQNTRSSTTPKITHYFACN